MYVELEGPNDNTEFCVEANLVVAVFKNAMDGRMTGIVAMGYEKPLYTRLPYEEVISKLHIRIDRDAGPF